MTIPTLRIASVPVPGAALGVMTRAMPGGDGSLEWELTPEQARRLRNHLREGAEVRLVAGGQAVWGGVLTDDPLKDRRVSPSGSVPCAASGLWGWAARRRDMAWVWNDSDVGQWLRLRQKYDAADPDGLGDLPQQSKFTTDTEGRLYMAGDADRVYRGHCAGLLAYWLLDGRNLGCRIVGLDVSYRSHTPSLWRLSVHAGPGSPWETAASGTPMATLEWTDETSRSSWRVQDIDLTTADARSLVLRLHYNDASTTSPASDPFWHIRSVTVRCRMAGASVDRSVTIDKAMLDIMTMSGLATVTDAAPIDATNTNQLAFYPGEQSVPDIVRGLAGLANTDAEYGFDIDPVTGTHRAFARPRPAACDWSRSVCWHYGGRGGEDYSGLVRDAEMQPECVLLVHRSVGAVGVPDGQPRFVYWPAAPSSPTARVHVVSDLADEEVSNARAAVLARRHYERMGRAAWMGEMPIPSMLRDVRGSERPGYLVRPGDRVSVPALDEATNLYVAETSWDWQSMTGSMTIGWPWDEIVDWTSGAPARPPGRRPDPRPLGGKPFTFRDLRGG